MSHHISSYSGSTSVQRWTGRLYRLIVPPLSLIFLKSYEILCAELKIDIYFLLSRKAYQQLCNFAFQWFSFAVQERLFKISAGNCNKGGREEILVDSKYVLLATLYIIVRIMKQFLKALFKEEKCSKCFKANE